MKKVILALFLASTIAASASNPFTKEMNYSRSFHSIEAGLNINDLTNPPAGGDYTMKCGWNIGLLNYKRFLEDNNFLKYGVIFTTHGAEGKCPIEVDGQIVNATTSTLLNYLRLPMIDCDVIPLSSNVALTVEVGPYMEILLNSRTTEKYTVDGQEVKNHEVSKGSPYNRWQLGMEIGGGVNVGKFHFGVVYDWGINRVWDAGNNCNRTFSVQAGFLF